MVTATTEPKVDLRNEDSEMGGQRFALGGVSWKEYEWFLKAVGNRRLFLTYDRGKLELMSPSYVHERVAEALAAMVVHAARLARVPFSPAGMTTFRRKDLEKGLEPDRCFYFSNVQAILGLTELDLTRNPPPDLAIEVDFASSSLNRMAIYAPLGVPEVWRFSDWQFQVHLLRPGGDYEAAERSEIFPWLPVAELPGMIQEFLNRDGLSFEEHFLAWAKPHFQSNGTSSEATS